MNNKKSMTIQKMMMKAIAEKGVTQKSLSQIIGASNPAISHFLKGSTELSFFATLKMVRHLFDHQQEQEVMETYIRSLKRKENIRCAMEYCSLTRQTELLKWLIDRELGSNNDINRQWAGVYHIFYHLSTREKSLREIHQNIRSERCNTIEMQILSRIIEAYTYHDKRKYATMLDVSEGVDREIEEIDNEFIRKSFTSRIGMNYAIAYLRANLTDKARYYAEKSIESDLSQWYSASAYEIIGLSYSLENLDESLVYLKKAQDIFSKINPQKASSLTDTFAFVNNLWGQEIATDNMEEVAHREIRKGNYDKAIEILETLEDSPFVLFYKGIAKKDVNLLWESFEIFLSRGDLFFANLPRKELIECGEKKRAVDAAYNSLLKLVGA